MKILAFDLECTSLSGMIGRVLCCSFKSIVPDRTGQLYTLRGDDRRFRNRRDVADDSKLVTAIRDELSRHDVWIAHNGKMFDRKFLNARLLKAQAEPLPQRFFVDTMWIVRSHLRVSSKLQNLQEFLNLQDSKTPITWDNWIRGAAFDRAAMNKIVEHCEKDVEVLEGTYWRILPLIRTLQRV